MSFCSLHVPHHHSQPQQLPSRVLYHQIFLCWIVSYYPSPGEKASTDIAHSTLDLWDLLALKLEMSLLLQLPETLGSILTHLTTLSTPVLWLRLPMTLCRLLLCSVITTKSASHRWCGKLFPGHHRTFGIIQNRVILFNYFFFHLLRCAHS